MNGLSESVAQVRPETPEDHDDIRRVATLAFGRDSEADMIDALRTAGVAVLSMLAVVGADEAWGRAVAGGEVVGQALATPVTVTAEESEVSLLGLGPVAVLPTHQRQGIGTLLVETCLEQLRREGHAGTVVVGPPEYFARFGFIPASRWGLHWDGEMPDEIFMALELTPGLLSGIRGTVRVRPELLQA